jgi:hypothetical protein
LFACKLSRHNTDRSHRKSKYTHGATMHTGDINNFEIRQSVKKKLQITDIANGRTNEQALSAILTVERGYNINKINLGAIDKLNLLQN